MATKQAAAQSASSMRIFSYLLAALIFLLPSNWFFKLFPETAYVQGLLVDYLIPKIYATDIIILIWLLIWVVLHLKKPWLKPKKNWLTSKKVISAGAMFVLLFGYQFFTAYPLASTWYALKIVLLTAFTLSLRDFSSLWRQPLIFYALAATLMVQSLLALYQFQTQHSLAGYWLLGESNLSAYSGIAKTSFFGGERALPYGTTAHPNVLGGILTLYILLFIKKGKTGWGVWAVVGISLVALFLTQSISAWAALGVGMGLLLSPKIRNYAATNSKRSLALFLVVLICSPLVIGQLTKIWADNTSLNRRAYLQDAAAAMFLQHPILGVGLNNFTAHVEKHASSSEVVRFTQPVHHAGLLLLAETGLAGVVVAIWTLVEITRKYKFAIVSLMILLPILILDHYLLTLQAGLLMTILFIFQSRQIEKIS